jgi:hypothetical protein
MDMPSTIKHQSSNSIPVSFNQRDGHLKGCFIIVMPLSQITSSYENNIVKEEQEKVLAEHSRIMIHLGLFMIYFLFLITLLLLGSFFYYIYMKK